MVAPALVALGMTLLGGGGVEVLRRGRAGAAQAAHQAAIDAAAEASRTPGDSSAVFDPTTSLQSMQRFGLELGRTNPAALQAMEPLLGQIMTSLGGEAGNAVTTRGQDMTAATAAASLADQQKARADAAEVRAGELQRTLATTQRGIEDTRNSAIKGLRNDLDPIVGPLVLAGSMLGAGSQAPAGYAGDQQIIYGIAKLLDPVGPLNDSTVQSVAGSPSLSAMGERLFGKYLNGETLRPEERADLLQVGATLYQQQKKGALAMAAPILTTAERMQLPRGEIFNADSLLGDEQVAALLKRNGRPATAADDGPAVDGPELRAANSRLAKLGLPAVKVGETKAEYEARTK
jgi:hypothetical protein